MKIKKRDFDQFSTLSKEKEKLVIFFLCKRTLATYIFLIPILEDLQFKYQNKVYFYEIKGRGTRKVKEKYLIYRYPTFLFFENGKLVYKLEGFVNRQKLFGFVKDFLEKNLVLIT